MAATSPIKDPENGVKIQVVNETACTATGTDGEVVITFTDLKIAYAATLNLAAGYIANQYSISGNAVTFRIFKSSATAIAFTTVGAAGDLGAAVAIGYGR